MFEILQRCLNKLEEEFDGVAHIPLIVRLKTTKDLTAVTYFAAGTASAKFRKEEGSEAYVPTMRSSSRYAVVEPNYDTHPNSKAARDRSVDARRALRQWIQDLNDGSAVGILVAIRGLLQYREVRSVSVVHGFTDGMGTEHIDIPAVVLTIVAPRGSSPP